MRDRGEDQDRTCDPALSAPSPPAQGPGRVHRRGAAQERPGGVAAWTRRSGIHRCAASDRHRGRLGRHARVGESLVAVVRRRPRGRSPDQHRGGPRTEADRAAARHVDGAHRARTDRCWLPVGCLDGTDDRRPHRGAVRHPLPQPPRSPAAAPARLLRAAPSQAAGASRPGAPSHLAPQTLPAIKKKPDSAVASLLSATRRASGSMARSTRPGLGWVSSRA